ncbi:MAG: YceD family protein [Agromyces sp.]
MTANPLNFLVRDLIGQPGQMRELVRDIPAPTTWGEGLVAVHEGAILDLELRFESVHEGILATGDLHTIATGECGRCLDDMSLELEVEFQELFAYHRDEACEYDVQDDHVNLEPIIRDAVVLALPFQPVCRPDCPGLDPQTGAKLAAPTELTSTAARDPRWDALTKFAASNEADSAEAGPGA